jgi:hypothetical protein
MKFLSILRQLWAPILFTGLFVGAMEMTLSGSLVKGLESACLIAAAVLVFLWMIL